MSNRDFNNVQMPETEAKLLVGSFVGANGAAATSITGMISTVTRAGEGDWDLVLQTRHRYPSGSKLGIWCEVEGAAGDHAHPSAYDEDAGTLTVSGFTAAGAADDLASKRVNVFILVRNSTSRRAR